MADLTTDIRHAGTAPHAAARQSVGHTFGKTFGSTDGMIVAMAPGRVNLIGEHIDYNDGFVLPMTIDRAVFLALRPRDDTRCRIVSMNFQEEATWDLRTLTRTDDHPWANYLKGVQKLLMARGCTMRGVDGVVFGDVPLGSGLSSSAAIEVAMTVGLIHLFGCSIPAPDQARLCQLAENGFVGVQCGIMDQFVSRLGKRHQALFLDCRSLEYRLVPFDFGKAALLIVDTALQRELRTSAYNQRRQECEAAVSHFHTIDDSIRALRDVSVGLLNKEKAALPDIIRRRAQHVVSEHARVHEAVAALAAADMARLGSLMVASHRSLKDDYEVSCPELDTIVESAMGQGAFGSRMTGAGFGGCAIILAPPAHVPQIGRGVASAFRSAFGRDPVVMHLTDNVEAGILPPL